MKLLLIGIGGFIGAVLRYLVSGWAHQLFGEQFPYGTLAVNVLGSFILGLFLYLGEYRLMIAPQYRQLAAIGILGAFTTFSTFSYETLALLQESLFRQAVLNVALNFGLGLLAVWGGMIAAKSI
ncbi:MAG TPA: fluoride efflux transporter CrcB [Caldithrix abyssi]|uniref:Fluoride-specific ion channel FluC n=1 Tax=Caldithrix abyssi TaxID=187145 RepID=A0A7V4WTZ2_CALAY|nr:fluoride efflux transporter CrcB [Caldithrix abyssi]